MKLNNKGFAITAVLYGLLILFVFLVGSYLTVLTAKKNRVDNIVKDIENLYNDPSSDIIEEETGGEEESSTPEASKKYTVKIYYKYDDGQEVEVITKEVDNNGSTGQIGVSCEHTYATYENTTCKNDKNISIYSFIDEMYVENMQDKVYLTINNVNSDTQCTVYFES